MSRMKVFLVILLYYIFEINCLTKDDIKSFHMWKVRILKLSNYYLLINSEQLEMSPKIIQR